MIQDYLLYIYDNFKAYIDEGNNLCKLKGLHFDLADWPDYSDINIQQLYLLRYAYAYAFEYKNMFDTILQRDTKFLKNKKIRMLSLGCGACLDYIGARYALDEYGEGTGVIRYTGIDCVDWQQNAPAPKYDDSIVYDIESAGAWLDNQESLNCNVLVFPKSICEFPESEFNDICCNLGTMTMNRDTIHLMVSLRNTNGLLDFDMSRTKKVVSALRNNGYSTSDKVDYFTHFTDKTKGILSYDNSFVYPQDALEMLKTLNEYCCRYLNGSNCYEECLTRLVRWPILKPTTIAYQILSFER